MKCKGCHEIIRAGALAYHMECLIKRYKWVKSRGY